MKIVVIKCDDNGNIDVADLKAKAEQYKNELSALMVTYHPPMAFLRNQSLKFAKSFTGMAARLYGWRQYERASGLNQSC